MRSPERVAVTHVNVVPMDREVVLRDRTVVIDDGRIESIAPAATIDTGRMRVIAGEGKWLMPGLSDMHVHFWDPSEAWLFLANGVTHVRNMWGTPLHLAWRQKVARREVAGPRMTTTSPIVDGVGPDGKTTWPGSVALTNAEEARPLVARLARRGYPQVKAYTTVQTEAFRALAAAARAEGLLMTGHCPRGMKYEEAIDAGMRCFEHLAGIDSGHMRGGERPPTANLLERFQRLAAIDLDQVRALAARMAREDIWNCPTLVVLRQLAQARADALATPHLEHMRAFTRESWDPKDDFRFRGASFTWDELVAAARIGNEHVARIVGILHEEGAPLLLGTDMPNPYVVPGFSIHQELAHFRAAGLSPYAVLRTGTIEAARFLGEAADWGTVEPGRRADLVLLSRDPLQDVGALRNVEHVFVNGHDFDRAALDALLEERLRDVARETPPLAVGPEDTAWSIVQAARPFGRLATRRKTTGTGTLLEEDAATFLWGETHRRASARVDAGGALQKMTATIETGFGTETLSIERSREGYRAHLVAVDGRESESAVESGPVPASLRVLISGCTSFGPAAPKSALTFEEERLMLATVTATSTDAAERVLTFTRPGESLEFVLSLDDAGEVIRVSQRLALGVREWVVERPSRPSPAKDQPALTRRS